MNEPLLLDIREELQALNRYAEAAVGGRDLTRLKIAVSLVQWMLDSGGTKADKVKAAFEYADLLLAAADEAGAPIKRRGPA